MPDPTGPGSFTCSSVPLEDACGWQASRARRGAAVKPFRANSRRERLA